MAGHGPAVAKQNLFELLGQPLSDDAGDDGTRMTATIETFDDRGVEADLGHCGTFETRVQEETFDDDMALTPIADHVGTIETKTPETFDDDMVLASLADDVGTVETKQFRNETFDDAVLPFFE